MTTRDELAEEQRIDQLRLSAFKNNNCRDRQAYFDAVSKWFQDRHYRRLASRQEVSVEELADSFPCLHRRIAEATARALLAKYSITKREG